MIGSRSRTRKDKTLKVFGGQAVKTGEILSRGREDYKPGFFVGGRATLFSLSSGTVYFTRKKTSHGRVRTFINVMPKKEP